MKANHWKIAVIEGDGIGPEVVAEALKVVNVIAEKKQLNISFHKRCCLKLH